MTDPQSSRTPLKAGRRHPLLFQQHLNEQVFWPCIAIMATSAAFLLWHPARLEPYRLAFVVGLAGGGLVLVLSFIFRLRAYVQCQAGGLFLRLPFYHLLIPYPEIKAARPTELFRMFPADQERWPNRGSLRSLLGQTVVVIELDQLPQSSSWLRLWMNRYMLCPDSVGLVLAVRDWLAFRIELDEFRVRRPRR